jgi:N-acetylneuraminate synthase/N,N'-diacetyllegionaminate synthase
MVTSTQFSIAGRIVGPGYPCFIIAEAGVNHNGDPALARQVVTVAARAGADAVKFQTFKADALASPEARKAEYQRSPGEADESQHAMLRRLELSAEMHRDLMLHCQQEGILFLSSPFDESAADFLVQLNVKALKIPSGEITNIPFLRHIAALCLPTILSTGMADLGEVETAVRTLRDSGAPPLALLHCVSNYPALPSACNLRAMTTLSAAFGVPIGFSDHTLGTEVSLGAVALGACIIEKHFTLDKKLPGPDHPASLEPDELMTFVRGIRAIEEALGHGRKEPVHSERETALVARKSLVASLPLSVGECIEPSMILIRRPGDGIPPAQLSLLIGRKLRLPVRAGQTLQWDMFQ